VDDGAPAFGLPFIGFIPEVGFNPPTMPLGTLLQNPPMGRVIMASSRGEPIDIAYAIKGNAANEYEDWMMQVTSPGLPWTIATEDHVGLDASRGSVLTIPMLIPRSSVVESLNHYATHPRYEIARYLAQVVAKGQGAMLKFEVAFAKGASPHQIPPFTALQGFGTLTMLGRDRV
jgi:hypothetical protein